MKKILVTLMLLTVMIHYGCDTEVAENEQENDQQMEQYDPEEDDSLLYAPQTGLRDFEVTAGEHGYLGVGWIELINDYFPNRLAFSDRELEAAEWIIETLLEMGFDESQIEMQTFGFDTGTSSWWGDASWSVEWFEELGYYDGLERIEQSQNVILTIPGRSEKSIIIGAHYDGVDNPGISDNAGGIVLLLENAYRMRDVDHYYTLQYVFFGAEEVGLIGAFYFADNMAQEEIDNLVMMINADVIMDGPELVYAVGYVEELPVFPMDVLFEPVEISQNLLSEQVKGIADQLNARSGTELLSKPSAVVSPTDQLAFLQFGIPVMGFYGTNPARYPETFVGDVLHSERDCLDFIVTNHPGRIERALYQFGVFLEEVVSSEFE